MPATANSTVTFRSKHSLLRLVRKSTEQLMNPSTGNLTVVSPEVVYEFKDGVLEVAPGTDVLPDKTFDLATQSWESQDAVEYLRSHDLLNVRFVEVEAIPTDPAIIYEAITDALLAGDLATIEALGDEEFATFKRVSIMERLEAARIQLEQAQVKQDEPPPKGK